MLDEKREGKDLFKSFNMAAYAKKNFGMFGGEERAVKLVFENEMVGVLIDRFGKDITIRPVDEGHTETTVTVFMSDQLFGWIFGLGGGVKIVGPGDVTKKINRT